MTSSDMFSWMEEPFQLDSFQDENAAPFEVGDVIHQLGSVPVKDTRPCAFSSTSTSNQSDDVKSAFLKDCGEQAEIFGTPEPFQSEGDDFDDDASSTKWEDDLSQLVESSDREVPVMDEKTKDDLVNMPVKEFNVRTKQLKLDAKVLQHLKLCRKRLKNRQAAIRSRSKKENETLFLQKRVDELTREKEHQQLIIKQLQQRLAELEKKTSSA